MDKQERDNILEEANLLLFSQLPDLERGDFTDHLREYINSLIPEEDVFEAFVKLVGREFAEKFDKEILEDDPKCYLVKCDWKTAYLELAKMVDKQECTCSLCPVHSLLRNKTPDESKIHDADTCGNCKHGKKFDSDGVGICSLFNRAADAYCICNSWIQEKEPCINCGQTEGEIYKGQPHDHVCADCGREKPYVEVHGWDRALTRKELEDHRQRVYIGSGKCDCDLCKQSRCVWCRKEPRILGADLCRKCIKRFEDIGLTYG